MLFKEPLGRCTSQHPILAAGISAKRIQAFPQRDDQIVFEVRHHNRSPKVLGLAHHSPMAFAKDRGE